MPYTRNTPESAWVNQHDTLVEPLLTELAHEYSSRYDRTFAQQHEALLTYPAEQFSPPEGGLLVLVEDAHAIAGGAFQHYHGTTAELKRIWTHSAHRRRGLARRVVSELEAEAVRRGYERIFLTTGPRQPEAKGLYLAAGYTPLFDVTADPLTIGKLPFEKSLTTEAGTR
jgi:polar amino acid transport system permease protein